MYNIIKMVHRLRLKKKIENPAFFINIIQCCSSNILCFSIGRKSDSMKKR